MSTPKAFVSALIKEHTVVVSRCRSCYDNYASVLQCALLNRTVLPFCVFLSFTDKKNNNKFIHILICFTFRCLGKAGVGIANELWVP